MKYIFAIPQFFFLNIMKVIFANKYKSAWDYDRLCFEFHLCTLSSTSRILFVGVHERSWVYQQVFKFDFCDTEDTYLKSGPRFLNQNCILLEKKYDLVVLSGVLHYGSDNEVFCQILNKVNFKSFLILDWIDNINSHHWIRKSTQVHFLKRTFYYYIDIKNA